MRTGLCAAGAVVALRGDFAGPWAELRAAMPFRQADAIVPPEVPPEVREIQD